MTMIVPGVGVVRPGVHPNVVELARENDRLRDLVRRYGRTLVGLGVLTAEEARGDMAGR